MSGASGNDSEAHSRASQSVSTIVPAVTMDNTYHNLQITTQKLNRKNFLQWSRSAALVIRGKGKIAFIDGSSPRLDIDDPSYASWDANNSLVMVWLIHSMVDEIGETYLFHSTAKEIWDAVALAYSDLENSSQLFELRNQARNLRQGDMDVTQYYSSLRKLWQEVDMFHSVSWKDPVDALLFKKLVQKDRVYNFLAGLNKELDDVRGRLLGIHPLHSIDEIFAEVRREDHHRRVMLGDTGAVQMEASALAANRSPNQSQPNQQKKHAWCTYCNKAYHTRETCWLIHGKPENFVPNRLKRKGVPPPTEKQVVPSAVNLTKAQVEHLCSLLSNSAITSTPVSGTSHSVTSNSAANISLMARQGISEPSVASMLNSSEQWIVDSGATDHMTGFEDGEEDWQC